jgi:hypothetical protein
VLKKMAGLRWLKLNTSNLAVTFVGDKSRQGIPCCFTEPKKK